MHTTKRRISIFASIAISMHALLPVAAIAQTAEPYQIDFVLTAYYSPKPDQCCYIRGSEAADKVLNGQGTHGADGTAVYPGMIAAPPSYAFGTRVELPELGIFTVHDRGGAIQEWDDAHRIDIWVGEGEEGLARALAFGVQRVRGTVYPVGTSMPEESVDLAALPAPLDRIAPFAVASNTLASVHPSYGSSGPSVATLQETLRDAGYFDHAITNYFGDVTQQSLAAFIADMELQEPSTEVTPVTAAYLQAALTVKADLAPIPIIDQTSSPSDIKKAQRLLRYFGFYRGRTDGLYSDKLISAIVAFQQSQQLVTDGSSPGAGRLGPLTKQSLSVKWAKERIIARAQNMLDMQRVRSTLAERNVLVSSYMSAGQQGDDVRDAQKILASLGFFPSEYINGVYGPQTVEHVIKYQLSRGIIESETDQGAGVIGPQTLATLQHDQVKKSYAIVRAHGWVAL